MSTWMHVSGIIRAELTEREWRSVLGETALWDEYPSPDDVSPEAAKRRRAWRILPNRTPKAKHIPMGSEGSLDWMLTSRGCHEDYYECGQTFVTIWGDLRDYSDRDYVRRWFERVCRDVDGRGGMIREAVLSYGCSLTTACTLTWDGRGTAMTEVSLCEGDESL